MTNGEQTKAFLKSVGGRCAGMIAQSVAEEYGITTSEAFAEITDPEAEHLLDYLRGGFRDATSALMQKHGFAK